MLFRSEKEMKRTIALLVAFMMVLAACSSSDDVVADCGDVGQLVATAEAIASEGDTGRARIQLEQTWWRTYSDGQFSQDDLVLKTDLFVAVGVNDQSYRFNERWDGDDPALLASAVCEIREGFAAEFGSTQSLSVDEERAEDINAHLFKMQEMPDAKIITLRIERSLGKNGLVDASTDMNVVSFQWDDK